MSIYETVPEEQMSGLGDKQMIVAVLRAKPGNFYNAHALAELCGFSKKQTQVDLRKAITELIEEDGCPIVGNKAGFAWAAHPNMINHYIESLEARRRGLDRRIQALMKIAMNMENQ